MRATRDEIERCATDESWWPGVLASIRETGSITEIRDQNVWSYGAFIGWIRGDSDRSAQYDEALKDYAHGLAMQCVGISDEQEAVMKKDGGYYDPDVGRDKLRIDTRLKLASKWDRKRYGESADQIGVLLDPLSEMLKEISERKIAALRAPVAPERVIEATHTVVSEDEI